MNVDVFQNGKTYLSDTVWATLTSHRQANKMKATTQSMPLGGNAS